MLDPVYSQVVSPPLARAWRYGSVRKAFTVFWKSHRDTWEDVKALYSPEDLEVINDFFTGPHYYA